jgi:hypothetical protein
MCRQCFREYAADIGFKKVSALSFLYDLPAVLPTGSANHLSTNNNFYITYKTYFYNCFYNKKNCYWCSIASNWSAFLVFQIVLPAKVPWKVPASYNSLMKLHSDGLVCCFFGILMHFREDLA